MFLYKKYILTLATDIKEKVIQYIVEYFSFITKIFNYILNDFLSISYS